MSDIGKVKLKAARLSVLSNTLLVIAKLIIGILMGSVAVISEAIHSGIDLLAAIIAFLSIKKANEPADEVHPYGHGKFEDVSGTVEAILIFGAAVFIIYEAVKKLINHSPVENIGLGVMVMGVSSLVNWMISGYLFKIAKKTDSIALEADAWHLRTDVYTSLGVMLGLGLIYLTNWPLLDPLAAIAVALLIIKASWDLTRKSFSGIIDTRLPQEEEIIIRGILDNHNSAFLEYHELRSRKSGSERFMDLHLVVPPSWSVEKVHDLCDHLENEIKEAIPNLQAVIHIEPCSHEKAPCDFCQRCELLDKPKSVV